MAAEFNFPSVFTGGFLFYLIVNRGKEEIKKFREKYDPYESYLFPIRTADLLTTPFKVNHQFQYHNR